MDADKSRLPKIAGYITEAVLGDGGMATVYLAVQESLSRHVALKVMNQILIADADFRRRFLNEGRLIARLSHPNIVTVYDIGVSDGIHYLSMTYLPGGTLREKMREGLPLDRALYIVRRLAAALGYAHSNGIVHRDIKPGNVLFAHDGAPVLTDFGIAKTVGNETQLTSTGMTVGSAWYMSPEQARGHQVDSRSDLYSLGVLFWEMLTGGLPYSASDPFALALKHATDPVPELPRNRRQLQPVLEGLLAKRPEDRFASADAFLRAIDEIPDDDARARVPSDPDATVVLPQHLEHTSSGHRKVATEVDEPPPSAPKRRLGLVATLTAIVALAGVVGFLGFFGPHLPTAKAPPASQPAPLDSVSQPRNVLDPPDAGVGDGGALRGARVPSAEGAGSRSDQTTVAISAEDKNRREVISAADEQSDKLRSIAELLRRGELQWKAGRFIEPEGDNAFESFGKVLGLDPQNAEARQRLVQIGRISAANKVFQSAEGLLRQGEIDAARRMIDTGLMMRPDDERLLGLKRALDYRQ